MDQKKPGSKEWIYQVVYSSSDYYGVHSNMLKSLSGKDYINPRCSHNYEFRYNQVV